MLTSILWKALYTRIQTQTPDTSYFNTFVPDCFDKNESNTISVWGSPIWSTLRKEKENYMKSFLAVNLSFNFYLNIYTKASVTQIPMLFCRTLAYNPTKETNMFTNFHILLSCGFNGSCGSKIALEGKECYLKVLKQTRVLWIHRREYCHWLIFYGKKYNLIKCMHSFENQQKLTK